MDPLFPHPEEADAKRERHRARELRNSEWWKRKLAAGVCHYCGKKFPPGELTMDHVVPVSRGGRSVKGNAVTACKACNTSKKGKLLMEWDEYLAGNVG